MILALDLAVGDISIMPWRIQTTAGNEVLADRHWSCFENVEIEDQSESVEHLVQKVVR